jgi:hypothetical protein
MIQAIPLWVYYALMAAGTGAQMMGERKVSQERAKAMREESDRRAKLTRENDASAEKSKQLFTNAQGNEDARAKQLATQIAATPSPITPAAGGQGRLLDPNSPPSATSTVEQARDLFAQGDAKSAARVQAKGQAGAFGSVFDDYVTAMGRNAQDMDINSTSMRNWNQNVLPYRLQYANESGRDWSTTGDILKLAGTIMAPMALGGGAGAGTATQQIGAARWGDAARLAQGFGAGGSIPFGSAFGQAAAAGFGGMGAMGAGIASDPRLQELLSLQRLGHRLSLEDLAYIKEQQGLTSAGMMH